MPNGDYITFIDSDDYIHLEFLEILYKNIQQNQVEYVKCNIVRTDNKGITKISLEEKRVYYNEKNGFDVLYDKILNTYELNNITATLIKRDRIKHKFNEKYNYAEDYLFNIEVIRNINSFMYINYNGYYYRRNQNSLTNEFNKEKFINKFEMAIKAYKEIYDLFPNYKDVVNSRIEKETKHILDSLFYVQNYTTLKERLEIYVRINKILIYEESFSSSFDLKLLINKYYILYDIKNSVIKKFPRVIKHKIMRKNSKG